MQDQHPHSFQQQIASPRAQAKSIYEKELMAMCLAIQKWRHYLLGRHSSVRTNQQSFRFLCNRERLVHSIEDGYTS